MRNFKRQGLKVLLAFIVACICLTAPFFILDIIFSSKTDTLDEPKLLSIILPEDTKYSLGYSHEKFKQIKLGMTEKQVIQILGEPQLRWRPYLCTNFVEKRHFVGLQYSESPSGSNYRLRQIYLDNGVVSEIIHYFYID